MNMLIFAATTLKEATTTYPEYVPYVITAISSIATGFFSYLVGRKKSSKSELGELVSANKKFRDEIKIELDEAKETIGRMEKTIEEKGKILEELQAAIADLKQQIISKETKISDMQMEMIKKDYQIQLLSEKDK